MPENMKKALANEPNFTNVTVNLIKNRATTNIPPPAQSRTPVIGGTKRADVQVAKSSQINRGSVTKAAFPSYVGMTPEYDNILFRSTQPSMT